MSASQSEDVDAILADLQAALRKHRAALESMGVLDPPDPLANVRQHQWVNSHLPIGWPKMPRGLVPKLVAYAQKITRRLLRWYINPIIDQQNALNAAVSEALARHEAALARQERESVALRQQVEAQIQSALAVEREGRLQQEEALRLRLQRLENWAREGRQAVEPAPEPSAPSLPSARSDDFVLGALYRNVHQMAARLGDYDDLFLCLVRAQADGRAERRLVLDVGAGRGEFAEHLAGLGLDAYGIDIDADAVAIGREAGRDVRCEDALTHLQSLPDGSLAAVSLIQVVEHFRPEQLLTLFRLIAAKLAPGGFILAETINPVCLWALANWYLLDPTHRTPLHPELARFLLEQAGLHRIETRYLHAVPDAERLQSLPEVEGLPSLRGLAVHLQQNTEQLNRFLYGPQDYAIVAYRPGA
ncbi:MAG: class I SAM-dependent methyltransferase [Anaerolineae bacterium]|nr:class I SAM-dependent methyltransferase [Anaerolineae bacterium]